MGKPILIEDLGMIYPTEKSKKKAHFAVFECPYCHTNFKASINAINRIQKSCGCLKKNSPAKTHGMSDDLIYHVWERIKRRCNNKNNKDFVDYGGRGIIVCEEWKNNFMSFYNWAIVHGYKRGLYIDRINVDGNYCPENCRWVDSFLNAQNRRPINKTNKSGYCGIFKTKYGRWMSSITNKKERYYLGTFDTGELAARIRNDMIIKNGWNHPLNIIP